jgi:hypothetical protein
VNGIKAVLMCSVTSVVRCTPRIVADTFLYFVPVHKPIYCPATEQPGKFGLLTGKGAIEGFRGTYRLAEKEEEDNAKMRRLAGKKFEEVHATFHHPAGMIRGSGAFQAMFHFAISVARKIQIPYLVITLDTDTATPAKSAMEAAKRAPKGESVQFSGKHFDPFLGGKTQENCIAAQLKFLDKIFA